jgi:hypothetical protein
MRTGVYYFNGASNQFQWYSTYENQIGAGLWYDF